ncbi:MAG: S41 family peptidase [Clostridia bacterium]|nr:S41 family peptidase [Clostridia bacterium]
MNKKIAWYWTPLAVILAVLITFMSTFVAMKVQMHQAGNDPYTNENLYADPTFAMVRDLFEQNYIGELPEFDPSAATDRLIEEYIAAVGDPYARYMNPQEYKEYNSSMQGDLVGIGVQVTYDVNAQAIEILLVMPDSPAEKMGLVPGDLIVAVEGVKVSESGYTAAADAIVGEEGTNVTLTVRRKADGKEVDLIATRAHVTALSVSYQMLSDGHTGLIRIFEFNATTPSQFKKAVDDLTKQGADRLIYDLRNNPGGQLDSVLSVLSYLLPKGSLLIRINDAKGNEETYSDTEETDHTVDLPMAVLINGNTASAAELFTSCLRDYEKVTIVGEKSFGKGCMQYVYGLPNGGALTLTTRMYSPPSGKNYDGKGITPHVAASLSEAAAEVHLLKLTEETDDQLKAAIRSFSDPS